MITFPELITELENDTKTTVSVQDIANILGVGRSSVYNRIQRNSPVKNGEYVKIKEHFSNPINDSDSDFVAVLYRPDVKLSAGYGVMNVDEKAEFMLLDNKLFQQRTQINPKNCEIVTVSGNSMAPEYIDGDRVILDKSYTEFLDGQIFAFRLNGECYIKEIAKTPHKVKCLPLNKDYDSFYIEENDDVQIFGRIVPRVRL